MKSDLRKTESYVLMGKRAFIALFFTFLTFAALSVQVFAAPEWDGSSVEPQNKTVIDGVFYYQISTPEELAYIAQNGDSWLGYNYILTEDIVLNQEDLTYDQDGNLTADTDSLNVWTPIHGFSGTFDGDGHSVSGVYVDTDDSAGFFKTLEGSVKNLTVKNAYIKGGNYVGGICGFSDIEGDHIENCTFYGAVIGENYVGGITGKTDGYAGALITDCTNYGDIWSVQGNAGGIVGLGNIYTASVNNCVNRGQIYSEGDNVGGIAGDYFWLINECINYGNVTGGNCVGGICGYKVVPVDECKNYGDITGKSKVGGITGCCSADSDGADVYNTGKITGETYVGGICGYGAGRNESSSFTLERAYNTGDVAGNEYVGGLIGYMNRVDLSEGYSTGVVTGTGYVGGIAGSSESVWGKGTVSDCYYLKTDEVNAGLYGFGNTGDIGDLENVTTAKEDEFFCINPDKTFNVNGHSYSNGYDESCDICGKLRTIIKIENPFTDISEGQYYYEPVLWALGKEITSGYTDTEFAPDYICTRGQLITFLWRANGCPEPERTYNPFDDIKDTDYYYKAVLWAVEKDITSGVSYWEFAPDQPVTRGQVVTFLYRAKGNPSYDIENPFKDVASGTYYYDAVLWAVENGITDGLSDTEFAPENNCTRGQVVTFLCRAYDH